MPMNVYYLVKIILIVFNNIDSYQQILTRNRGPILGWYLFNIMCEYYATDVGTVYRKPKQFHICFNVKQNLITMGKWRKNVRVLTFWLFNSLKHDKNLSNKQDVAISYRKVFLNTEKELDNSGIVVTNNLLTPAAILGLIPLKFIHKFHSANLCPGLHYLVENYNLLSGMEGADKFLELLCHKLIEE